MQITEFALERIQSLHENEVDINLSDSGVHPYSINSLLTPDERTALLDVEMGYGWTNGTPALRETIATMYPGRSDDEVLVTNGSAEAIFVMGMTVLEPGDELIVITPNYLQLWGWAQAIGVKPVAVALREDRGWAPDLDELAAAITPRTRMISICHPNNPTGSVLAPDQMTALVELARRHGLWLHADEVYRGTEFSGTESPSFADLYERAIVTSGLSKAYALPGLRIGWIVGPAAEIATAWGRKDYTSITTGALSEAIATIALRPERRAAILERSRRMLGANLDIVADWIGRHDDLLSWTRPAATGTVFVRYDLPVNSTELVHRIRREQSVLLVPGDVFGLDGYLRLGTGPETETLRDGLRRLDHFLARALAPAG